MKACERVLFMHTCLTFILMCACEIKRDAGVLLILLLGLSTTEFTQFNMKSIERRALPRLIIIGNLVHVNDNETRHTSEHEYLQKILRNCDEIALLVNNGWRMRRAMNLISIELGAAATEPNALLWRWLFRSDMKFRDCFSFLFPFYASPRFHF